MNQQRFRLVFDRRRGMCVPASEHARGRRKSASGTTRSGGTVAWAGGLGAALSLVLPGLAGAATAIPRAATVAAPAPLPVRAVAAQRTATDTGSFSLAQPSATQLQVTQTSARAIINWDSFNVAAGHQVRFVQPDKGSTLNRIWDANPSVVQGRIQANGEVLLENTNGVIFGATARVETGRFVATALRVADKAYLAGLRGVTDGSMVLGNGDSESAGFVSLERGAEIKTAAGGDVLVFGPQVLNEGRIETPDGQTVLGAGREVYMTSSADPAQRGLIVRMQPFSRTTGVEGINTVTQAAAGTYHTLDGDTVASAAPGVVDRINAIVAERGSINLVAFAIRQNGVLQATTAVKGRNGVIQLLAQAQVNSEAPSTFVVGGTTVQLPGVSQLGSVQLGPASRTAVLPSADATQTQLDSETFNRSLLRVEGEQVWLQSGAVARVPSGSIQMLASATPATSLAFNPQGEAIDYSRDNSRIVVDSGAVVDAAGLRDVALPMSRNELKLDLFQNELADSPTQKNGALYRETIYFDRRRAPTIANVQGAYSGITRSAEEWSTSGGSIVIRSDGAVALDTQARLSVAGGSVRYSDGEIRHSLVRSGDQWVTLENARADTRYDELGNSKARLFAGNAVWQTESVAGYAEGKDAGQVDVAARLTYFGAQVDGSVMVGPLQTGRDGSVPPKAGALSLGSDKSRAGAVLLQDASPDRPAALFAEPLDAEINTQLSSTLVLSTAALGGAGLGTLQLYSVGGFTLAESAALVLAPGGRFVASAGSVRLDGSLTVPGGSIAVDTLAGPQADIDLGAHALLSTAGQWLRDDSTRATSGQALAFNGGSVSLSAAGGLYAEPGAHIDVSGGARLLGTRLSSGSAGSVSLALNVGALATLPLPGSFDGWHATLSGWDYNRGGRVTVSGLPSLTLGGDAGAAYFDAGFFSGQGFGNISLATLGDVTVASGLDLQLQLLNYVGSSATAGADGRFAEVALQPVASRRAAVSLSLLGSTGPALAVQDQPAVAGSSLTLQAGARISTEAGGSLRLQARRSLTVGGELVAPGGSISLTLQGERGGPVVAGQPSDVLGFDPTQALWLTSSARLDVSGAAELQNDAAGRPVGTVYGGGSVALTAQRGYVVAQAGAVLDLRGHAALAMTSAETSPLWVSRPAGTLSLATPEGFHFAADVRAQAADGRADGGSLQVNLSLNNRDPLTSGPAYDANAPRELRIVESTVPTFNAKPGDNLLAVLGNGVGTWSNAALQQAGFARVQLQADQRIRFDGNLTLAAAQAVVLDTPALAGLLDAEVLVRAPYVGLGDTRTTLRLDTETLPAASAGNAVLGVQAGLIELKGDMATQGFKFTGLNATLDAAGGLTRRDGEIRFIGVARGPQDNTASGSYGFAGELQLTAGLAYATTMADYTVSGQAGFSQLATYPPGGGSSSQAPLSAGASLTLKADHVRLAGVLYQPFGHIGVQAVALEVADDAVLSVSGAGQTVPLGTTVNGREWQYNPTGLYITGSTARSQDATATPSIQVLSALPVAKGLSLQADSVAIAAGAQISAAGGGDLQAWEFVAGVGGTSNTLAAPGLYAVLPGRSYDFAPYDAEVMASGAAASLRAGAQIDIHQPGSALAPGRYTLLPASYALLPGAALVSLAAPGNGPLTAAWVNDDGSAVVSGRLSTEGSVDTGSPLVRVRVETPATAALRTRIDTVGVGSFLAGQATRLDQAQPTLPVDAGHVALSAVQPLRLSTAVQLAAGTVPGDTSLGRAGLLDISMPGGQLAIVDDTTRLPAGVDGSWSLLDVDALNASRAGSLLVGGLRDESAVVATANQTVLLAATRQALTAGEVALVATDKVALRDNTAIQAAVPALTPGVQTATWQLDSEGALVLVAAAQGVDVLRMAGAPEDDTERAGALQVGAGARLQGAAVRLDGTGAVALDPGLLLSTQDFGLRTQRLAVGTGAAVAAAQAEGATALSGGLLAAVHAVQRLSLAGVGSIDFFGTQTFSADHIVLDAPQLRGAGDASDVVSFSAEELVLRNTSGRTADTPLAGAGTLRLLAQPTLQGGHTGGITIGSTVNGKLAGTGSQHLGFDAVLLQSLGDVVFAGSGSVLAQGSVDLAAARITATTAADQALRAEGGALRLAAVADLAGARSLGEHVGHAARLQLSGVSVLQAGNIDAPGALLDLVATGAGAGSSLVFAPGSITSVAGFDLALDSSRTVQGAAGRIRATAATPGAGGITLAGVLDVSAPGSADAGRIELQTPGSTDLASTATLRGASGSALAGRFVLDTGTLAHDGQATSSLDALASALDHGGLHDTVLVRVRQGDLSLDNAAIRAETVTLSADQGRVRLGGTVDAQAPAGGLVQIFGGAGVQVDGRIDAHATRPGNNGGGVTLGTGNTGNTGSVVLGANAHINAGGDDTEDGRIVLRAPRNDADGSVAVTLHSGFDSRTQLTAAEVVVEAVRTYQGYTRLASGESQDQTLGQATLHSDALAFAAQAGGVLAGLGLADDSHASLRTGVQVLADGDFTVADDWNLWRADRAGGQPGLLTLRVGGTLQINGSLSDGFASATRPAGATLTAPTEIKDGAAWSYRLVAGADLNAANPLDTVRGGAGDLRVASDKLVRTTAGSIDLAAAGSIVLATGSSTAQQGVVYVAGRPVARGVTLSRQSAWVPQFTAHGGHLSLTAGQDIVGAPSSQLFGAWFYKVRAGTGSAWFSAFDAYRQGIGSFGGGNVVVQAGGDIRSLGVVLPSSGVAGVDGRADVVDNGGDLRMNAGGDIAGGTVLLGRGQGQVFAEGAITSAPAWLSSTPAIGPLVGLMDASLSLGARGDVALSAVINPTLMASADERPRIAATDTVMFASYSANSALHVASQAGAVDWQPETASGTTISETWSKLAQNGPLAERIRWSPNYLNPLLMLPATVSLQALGGGLRWTVAGAGQTLFPSATGALTLVASGDLAVQGRGRGAWVVVSDRLADELPSAARPVSAVGNSVGEEDRNNRSFVPPNGAVQVQWDGVHTGGGLALQVLAGGDMQLGGGSAGTVLTLVSPDAATLSAGGDLRDLSLLAQHTQATQVSTVQAGGSLIQGAGNRITLAGPGLLSLQAGRQLDLGESDGVETVGNVYNPTLPDHGANLRLAAGLRAQVDTAEWTGRYLTPDADAPSASALAQAAADFADTYYRAIGRDPAALSQEDQADRSLLIDRYLVYRQAMGGDAAAVQQRRNALVQAVRTALALPALPEDALANAFSTSLAQFANLAAPRQAQIAASVLDTLFGQAYLAPGRPYAAQWAAAAAQAGTDPAVFAGPALASVRDEVLFAELNLSGGWAALVPAGARATRTATYGLGFFAADLAGLGASQRFGGDIDLVASGVQTAQGGNITLLAPGGQINVGLPSDVPTPASRLRGAIAYTQGKVSAFSDGDFQVNSQRVFVVGQGDLTVWSSTGDIDAGRGANTAVTIPPLVARRQADGSLGFELPSISTGSGIGIVRPAVGDAKGDIGLYAPNGEVLALDAQIRAPGRITLGAEVVRGGDNISGGAVVGSAVVVPTVSVAVPAESSSATQGQTPAAASAAAGAGQKASNSLLLLELLGLGPESGDEACSDDGLPGQPGTTGKKCTPKPI